MEGAGGGASAGGGGYSQMKNLHREAITGLHPGSRLKPTLFSTDLYFICGRLLIGDH